MERQEIEQLLHEKHQDLIDQLSAHDDQFWNQGPEGKWTTGQHIVHLIQSSRALNRALRLPKFILQYKFGKANRPPRTYDEVVKRYLEKLAAMNGVVLSPYSENMPDTPIEGKQQLIADLLREKDMLVKRLNRLSDKQLDKYLVPHPAMGRMLLREIIMWTGYHTEHHRKVLESKY